MELDIYVFCFVIIFDIVFSSAVFQSFWEHVGSIWDIILALISMIFRVDFSIDFCMRF